MVSNKTRNGIGFDDLLALTFCDPKVYPVDLDILQASVTPREVWKRNHQGISLMWIKKKKGVGSAQKLHTLGIVTLFNIISLLDDVSYHLSEFIFIHKNQVVFGTLYLTTLVKDEKGTLSPLLKLQSWEVSWNTAGCMANLSPPYRGRDRCWVEAFGPYFQTEWSSSIKGPGRRGGTGGKWVLPAPSLSASTSGKQWPGKTLKLTSLQARTFPQVGSIGWTGQQGACALRVNNVLWSSLYHNYGRYSILYLLSLFLISQLVRKMDQERKSESLSILKTPTSALVTQGLGGSARMLNGFLDSSLFHKQSFWFFSFHLNEVISGYNSMVVGAGWLGDSGSKEPAIGAYVCSFPFIMLHETLIWLQPKNGMPGIRWPREPSSQSFPDSIILMPAHTEEAPIA